MTATQERFKFGRFRSDDMTSGSNQISSLPPSDPSPPCHTTFSNDHSDGFQRDRDGGRMNDNRQRFGPGAGPARANTDQVMPSRSNSHYSAHSTTHQPFQGHDNSVPSGGNRPVAERELQTAKAAFEKRTENCGLGMFQLRNAEFADVILSTGNGEVLAHKVILASRSPIMKATFLLIDARKKEDGRMGGVDRLLLEGFSTDEVETFIECIYTGGSSRFADYVSGVFLLARKYEVQDLLALAEAGLYNSMNIQNVLDLYELAVGEKEKETVSEDSSSMDGSEEGCKTLTPPVENAKDEKLLKAVVQFIVKPGNKKAVMASDKWHSLRMAPDQRLYVGLLERLVVAM